MKSVGLLLPLILAASALAAEPPATPAPAEPTPAQAAAPAPTPAPAAASAPIPAVTAPAATVPAKPADSTAKPSPEVAQIMAAVLPKYDTPPTLSDKPLTEVGADTIELPKVIVKQKKRPRLGEEVMLTTQAFNEKLAKEKTSSFDRDFLNKYNWLGGATAAERAREEYDRAQRDQMIKDVAVLAKAIEQEDPAQAKALRDAANKP
jgi:hypothetical protein